MNYEIDMMEYCGHFEALIRPNEVTTFFKPEQRGYFTHLAKGLAEVSQVSKDLATWEVWILGKTSVYHCLGLSPDRAYSLMDDAITGKSNGFDLEGVVKNKAIIKSTKSDPMLFKFNANALGAEIALFSQLGYDNSRTQVTNRGWAWMKDILPLLDLANDKKNKQLLYTGLHRTQTLQKLKDLPMMEGF